METVNATGLSLSQQVIEERLADPLPLKPVANVEAVDVTVVFEFDEANDRSLPLGDVGFS